MALLSLAFVSIICVLITASLVSLCSAQPPLPPIVLVLQWRPTMCRLPTCNPTVRFRRPATKATGFTVHGVWQQPPIVPCEGMTFDMAPLLAEFMEPDLSWAWPSYTYNSDRSFWEHEWNVHGRCMPINMDVAQYFRSGLDLYKQFYTSVVSELEKAGMKVGTTFQATVLRSAMNSVPNRPFILYRMVDNQFQLFRVVYCVDAQSQNVVECALHLQFSGDATDMIYFPEFPRHSPSE